MSITQQNPSGQNRATSLPIKITLIVYWFLAITGAVVAVLIMNHLENDLARQFTYKSESAHLSVQQSLYHQSSLTQPNLSKILSGIRRSLDIEAIELKIDGQPAITNGIKSPQLQPDIRSFEIHVSANDHKMAQLIVYHPSLETALYGTRRNFLLGMGAFFILFGAVLAVVLRQIIAKPFSAMVKTAEKFSDGAQDSRFSTSSTDEFGYLAQFFNRILDQVLSQRDDLKEAFVHLKQSESTLSEEKERIEVTLHSIGDGVVTTNQEGIVEYLNPAAERLLNTTLAAAKGCFIEDVVDLVDEETVSSINNPVLLCLEENRVIEQDHKSILTVSGDKHVAVSYTVAPMSNYKGDVMGAVMVLHDVEQTRQLSRQLSYQASHDTLTNLYNRRAFEEHLQIALDTAVMSNKSHALCYLDLDQFKIVNDTCGHVAGDALLQQLAEVLRSKIRQSDVVARLGGDEFGILLQHCDADQAIKVAKEIHKLIGNFRFTWKGHLFETGVSIGLVSITPETQTVDQILSAADMACYIAKEKGRDQIHVYEPNDAELNQRRGEMQWVAKIKGALGQDRFQLYHQPIADVENMESGELHFEVLMRMLDENGELIPPMAFIPAAERYHLMPSIDRWVITNTFAFLRKNFPKNLKYTCSINLSGQSLSDEKFQKFVEGMLATDNITPENICFEVTETAAITHLDKAKRFINNLKRKGCKFSLDDFGSGLSSFSYLKDLNVDYLKIDGIFIKDMVDNPVDFAMVEAINRIGHVMKLLTIAEFVENEDIVKQLKLLGINYAQGYGIAKPAPIEELLDRVTQSGHPVLVSVKR